MKEEEVDLIDYLQVIWNHRRLIVGSTFACMLAALAASFFWPKTYEGSVILEVGKIYTTQPDKVELIEDPKNLEALLKGDAVVEQLKKRIGSEKNIKSLQNNIKINTKSIPLVIIDLKSESSKAVLDGLNFLAEWIINDHKMKGDISGRILDNNAAATVEKMKNLADKIRENGQKGEEVQKKIKNIGLQITAEGEQIHTDNVYLKTVEEQINAAKTAITESKFRISGLDVSKVSPLEILFLQTTIQSQELRLADFRRELNDLMQRGVEHRKQISERNKQAADFRMQILDLEAQNADLKSQIENLKQSISMFENLKANSENTKYRTAPVVLKEPISPHKGLSMIIAGILGLLISTTSVFFLEFIVQVNRREQFVDRGK